MRMFDRNVRMRVNRRGALVVGLVLLVSRGTDVGEAQAPAPPATGAQALTGADLVRATYTKYEYMVPMRDGVRLFTAVFVPKDASRTYPFLLTRTPYSVAPYGVDKYPAQLGSEPLQKEGFIFVRQDARGRYMSEGEFSQVRPFNPGKGPKDVDERTDTYDTIEWLLANVPNHNGRVGMIGVSAARVPCRGEHDRLAPGTEGGLAAGAHCRLLHGRRRVPQRRVHAGGELRVLLAVRAPRRHASAPAAGHRLRPRHAGHVRLLPAHAGAAGAHERGTVRRQGRLLAGDRRPHDVRRVLEAALAVALHGQRHVRRPERGRVVRRRGSGRAVPHLPCGRAEEPGHGEHDRDGPVVAWRLGARSGPDPRQPRLRRPDGGVLSREDRVPLLHGAPEGRQGASCPRPGCS